MNTTITTTKIYRNDTTGYRVTLIDNNRGYAKVADSKGYEFPMVGSDYPFAATLAASRARLNGAVEVPAAPARQMTSPLAVDAQVRSARPLADGGGVADLPTLPQARILQWCMSAPFGRAVARGHADHLGRTATHSQLIAMWRRGWLDLDNTVRPTRGSITRNAAAALAAYVAQHGQVL